MKFTDGYWQVRDGFSPLHPAQVDDVRADPVAGTLTVYAPTAVIRRRGDTLNRPLLTITYSSPAPGVIGVRIEHHRGGIDRGPRFELHHEEGFRPEVSVDEKIGRASCRERVF